MAEQWIWLGAADALDNDGKLKPSKLQNSVYPFLSVDSDKYELRLLIHVNDAAVLGWFRVLGQTDSTKGPTLENWTTVTLSDTWRWQGTNPPATWSKPQGLFNLPGNLGLTQKSLPATIGILTFTAKELTFSSESATFVIDITPSVSHFSNDSNSKPFDVKCEFKNGQLSVKDTLVTEHERGDVNIQIGQSESNFALRSFTDASLGERIGVEIPIWGTKGTKEPVTRAGSVLQFSWKADPGFLVRLHVSKATTSNSALFADLLIRGNSQPICTVDFKLPLVESPTDVDRPDSTPRLLLTKSTTGNAPEELATFDFSVELSAGGQDKDTLLLRFKLIGTTYVAELAHRIADLSALSGRFVEHAENFSRVLSSVFAKVDSLHASVGSVSFKITQIAETFSIFRNVFEKLTWKLSDFPVPLQLEVTLKEKKWVFIALARFDLWNGRLADNRIFVSAVPPDDVTQRTFDLNVFALIAPEAIDPAIFGEQLRNLATSDTRNPSFESLNRDGYLDVARGELVLDFKRLKSDASRALKVVFPGNLKADDPKYTDRIILKTEPFDPDNWPTKEKNSGSRGQQIHLRLGSRGLSVSALVDTGHDAEIGGLRLSLERARGERRSELVVIDNQVRLGTLVGKLDAPGFQGLQIDLLLGLRQTVPNQPPTVFAEIDLSRSQQRELLEMTVPGLRGRVDAVHLQLDWKSDNAGSQWVPNLTADGSISFLGFGESGGMTGLDDPDTFPFQNLDLLKFRELSFEHPLRRTRSGRSPDDEPKAPASGIIGVARWEILNGLIGVECTDVTLAVAFKKKEEGSAPHLDSARLIVKRPRLEFHGGTSVDIAIEIDALELSWTNRSNLDLSFSGPIGIEMRIGPTLAFEGKGGSRNTATEQYFEAFGALRCTGFPDIEATIKLGSGRKTNGRHVPNIVVYGSFAFEADLFPGIVLKRLGAGLSINNRLAALGRDPNPQEILARLEQIRPENVDNWRFDPDGDLYVALIGSAWAASNRGGESVISAYAMALTMIVDTNLDVVAAGEVWLFSSLEKIRQAANRSRPAMAGVVVFRPRKKNLSFVAETRPNPFIEANDQLAKVLSQCRARFSFYVSEDLVDYFLEEVSYRETFLDVEVAATGGYRIAIGRFGVLLRAWLHFQGELSQRSLEHPGVGGFTFHGRLVLDADFGGLIAADGVSAYGSVSALLTFRVSAFVMVPTPRLEMRRYKETISFTTSYPSIECGRWGCRTKWRDKTIKETIIVEVPELVIRNEPYRLPEQGVDLFLSGDVGFDSGGQIGFRGTVSISVNVFGHHLAISPKLEVKGRIIEKVKRRVAAVERSVKELRNLPRPSPTAPTDQGVEHVLAPPRWTLYERIVGDVKRCVLVPAPGGDNDTWYVPELGELADYATFPRDTTRRVDAQDPGAASQTERLHLTPLRNSVVRMIIPIKSDSDHSAFRMLDLVMPWDRANMDALPEPPGSKIDAKASDAARLRALKKINQIEAEMTAGAVAGKASDSVREAINLKRFIPEGITVVRDPRIGSNDRRFWKLGDQLERPDWAPPAEFRPVSELTAMGIAPPPCRGAGDATLQAVFDFERVSEQGLRAAQHEAASPTEATRLLQIRSSFLAAVLNDFERFPSPDPESHYSTLAFDDPKSPSRQMLVERHLDTGEPVQPKESQGNRAITRRNLPFICLPTDATSKTYEFQLTRDLLTGATNFVLGEGALPPDAAFKVTWDAGSGTTIQGVLNNEGLKLTFDKVDDTPAMKIARIELSDPPADYQGVKEDFLFIELHPYYSKGYDRKIGLIFDLKQGESVDLEGVRIVRNIRSSEPTPATAPTLVEADNWFHIEKPQLDRTVCNEQDSAYALHRTLVPLTPCQTFVPTTTQDKGEPAEGTFPTQGRLLVRLPVLFTPEFFTKFFAGVNRFEILRRFTWEQAPVSLGEFPFSATRWSSRDTHYVMPRTFLATDEFAVEGTGGKWRFVDPRLQPETPLVQYFLRVIPFGESARSIDNIIPLAWPSTLSLYLPARREPLPPLGIIFQADSLLAKSESKIHPLRAESESKIQPTFSLFDSQGTRFSQRPRAADQQVITLELWVKQEPIVPSGFYAPGDELTPDVTRAESPVHSPSDLTAAPLPEDTDGKHHYATITFTTAVSQVDSQSDGFSRQNFTLAPGFRYRWYVRPQADVLDRRVIPLHHYLARKIPESITRNTPLLPVDALEVVGMAEQNRMEKPLERGSELSLCWHTRASLRFERLKDLSCRSDLPASDQELLPNPTRVFWDARDDALDGGVELIFQDSFESGRVDRRLIEVHAETVFARAQNDFRMAGSWQAHASHASGRLWKPEKPNSADTKQPSWKDFVWTSSFNPLLSRLTNARADVVQVLEEVFDPQSTIADWRTLHQALANWFSAINGYLRSPLVQDPSAEEGRVNLLFARVRNLFLGLPDPATAGTTGDLQHYENQLATLQAAIDEVDRNDPRRELIRDVEGEETETFKQRLLDHEIASRLAEVIRGRLRIVDALREFTSGGTVDLPEAEESEKWPRLAEWNLHVSRWYADVAKGSPTASRRPLSNALLGPFLLPAECTADLSLYNKKAEALRAELKPGGFFTNLELLGLDLKKTAVAEDQQLKIGEKAARLVNEAAGLAAAIAGIRAVAEPRGWRLVKRPHHQVTAAGDAPQGESLANYIPSLVPGGDLKSVAQEPELTPAEGVVYYFNWLERMGFAIDLALVDEDNRYFFQRELIEQLQALKWKQLLDDVQPAANADYRIYILAGRESDTVLPSVSSNSLNDDDDALGYNFVKLAVVPVALLQDLSAQAATVTVQTVDSDKTITFKDPLTTTVFGERGSPLVVTRIPTADSRCPALHDEPALVGSVSNESFSTITMTNATSVQANETLRLEAALPTDTRKRLSKWLELRRVSIPEDPKERLTRLLRSLAMGADHLALNEVNGTRLIIVEPWGRRWQTVPSVGNRSHISHTAIDRSGRDTLLAGRRVSRYEPFLRWLGKAPLPRVERLTGLGHDYLLLIPQRRKLLAGEESRTVPVAVHPHPSRIEFLYRLPPSAARALLSAEARRRTGFLECQVAFTRVPPKTTQSFGNPGLPNSFSITLREQVNPSTELLVIEADSKITQHDLEGSVVLWPLPCPTSAAFVSSAQSNPDPNTNWRLTLTREVSVSPGSLALLVKPAIEISAANPLCPQVDFSHVSDNEYRLLGAPCVESIVGSSAIVSKRHHRDAIIVHDYDPVRRIATFSTALQADLSQGRLTILRWESRPEAYPIPVRTGVDPVELFRHERLISLAHLPYYLDYQAGVEARYAADQSEKGGSPSQAWSMSARRLPGWVPVHRPYITKTLEVTLFLNRLGDALDRAEMLQACRLDSTKHEHQVANEALELPTRHLLATDVSYQLWIEFPLSESDDSGKSTITKIADVVWKIDDLPVRTLQVTVCHNIRIAVTPPPMNGAPVTIPVNVSPFSNGAAPVYWMRFQLDVQNAEPSIQKALRDPKAYRLVAIHSGYESPMVSPHIEAPPFR